MKPIGEQKIPRLNSNDDSVELLFIHFKDGDPVKLGEPIAELGTSKVSLALVSDFSGFICYERALKDFVPVGQVIVTFFESREAALKRAKEFRDSSVGKVDIASPSGARLSKEASAYLQEKGVAPPTSGLWTKRRLLGGLNPSDLGGVARSERLSKAKLAEVESIVAGQAGNATSSVTIEFSAKTIIQRLSKGDSASRHLFVSILFELGQLLPSHPKFTSFYANDSIHYYDRIDLGVAVDLGSGLRLVTLRAVDTLARDAILKLVTQIVFKYGARRFEEEDLQGSTISVSDLSALGVRSFQPLIARRQAVTIGIGGDLALSDQPISITATFDHRVLTGFEVARFLSSLKKKLCT